MRIYEKTIEWLTTQQARYKAKLPLINEGEAKELAKQGLEMIEAEIERRQKKSEKQAILAASTNPSLAIPALNETLEKMVADAKKEFEKAAQKIENEQNQNAYRQALEKVPQHVKQFVQNDVETRLLGKIENPKPIAVPVVQIEFKDEYRQLNQAEIIALLKTYFKRVATSAGMEAGRYSNTYSSNMGRMVYKLFQGWNKIYDSTQEGAAWPPLENCFPGFKTASQNQRVNAKILWRWASGKKD
jgi:hypothetical protein